MSRFVLIGDPHAKPDNLHKIRKLCDIVENYNLPAVWLGDLLDTKDIVRAQCLNTYYKYFSTSKLKHIILVGNHDYTTGECSEHALETLKALPNVKVVDEPYMEGTTLFLPYYRDNNKLRNQLVKADVVICHMDIKSFDYGNGFISEEGIHPEELKDYKLIISGHYHKYQQKNNITYLGTPFSHNFGESNQDKYLGIFNDEDTSFSTISTDFPKHRTIELDLSNNHEFDINNVDHFRLIIKGNREQIETFDYSKYPGFKIVPEYVPEVYITDLKQTQTPEDMFSTWFTDIKKETDKELFNLGLYILKESK